jgi:Tfp pilus assembly protein PilF/TolB-like protein
MSGAERPLTDLAVAILDGTPVDWTAAEADASADERAVLEELRILEAVAGSRRRAGAEDVSSRSALPTGYWGRLRLIDRIGGGSFGEVYRAWDAQLHREVALKLIPVAAVPAADASAILEEGRLLARVRHPGVVTVYDVQVRGPWAALCMEFVDGETLEQRVRRDGPLSAEAVVDIGIQLSEAVAAVHDAGVLHRDVKAPNVVVQGDRRVMLTDFGAGRTVEGGGADLTGTPLYLAPEVLGGGAATAQSDIYSLGVLLHFALTGTLPIAGATLAEVRNAHAERARAASVATSWPPTVPTALGAIVDRALSVRADQRYDSARSLAAALRTALQSPAAPRRWLTPAAAALALLVLAGWWGGRSGGASPATASAPAPVRIAVLPFTGRAAGGDDLAHEGLTRDLMAHLQTFVDARVTANASARSVGALNLPVREAGLRLGADVMVTGSVDESDDTLVANVRVTSIPEGRTLWSRQYWQPSGEVLLLPRLIGDDVADALALQRRSDPQWTAANRDAHALYVRGRTALDRATPEGARLAMQFFERALALDPGHAAAHAAIAAVYLRQLPSIPNLSAEAALTHAESAAASALALDESLPEAHIAVASIRQARGDRNGAEREFRRAIELDPSNVRAREEYAMWLSLFGRFEEALVQAQAAELLDPLSPRSLMGVASVHRFARRYDLAAAQAQKALTLDPSFPGAWLNLGHDYLGLGRINEAIDAYQRVGRRSGNLGHALALAGRTDEARALALEFEEQYARTGLGAGDAAQIYSGLGDVDRAFAWLERMNDAQAGLTTLKVAAVWDPLRSDPRFAALLTRYGLTD